MWETFGARLAWRLSKPYCQFGFGILIQYLATGSTVLERLCVTSLNRLEKRNIWYTLFFSVSLLVLTPSVFARRYERWSSVCIRRTAGSLCSSPTWAHKVTRSRGEKTHGVCGDTPFKRIANLTHDFKPTKSIARDWDGLRLFPTHNIRNIWLKETPLMFWL